MVRTSGRSRREISGNLVLLAVFAATIAIVLYMHFGDRQDVETTDDLSLNDGSRVSSTALRRVLGTVHVAETGVDDVSGKIVARYPRDANAFTQGLVVVNESTYESNGLYGRSDVRAVERTTGRVLRRKAMDDRLFGEGLTALSDPEDPERTLLVQLTWKSRRGFVYDAASFEIVREFEYATTAPNHQGWGIATNGTHLYVSDGTSSIYVWDWPQLRVRDVLSVTLNGQPVRLLNELEWIPGRSTSGDGRPELLANVWYDSRILRIDPETGEVIGIYDCNDIVPADASSSGAVLNGLAYITEDDTLLVTGKLWSSTYRVRA